MIVDSSAVIAIIRAEIDAPDLAQALAAALEPKMSAANWLEASIVVDSARDLSASEKFDQLLLEARVAVVPVTPEQAAIARRAYRAFGRGSGSPARLNFGDCFAYALSMDAREPLLFKGNDFTHTDVAVASVANL